MTRRLTTSWLELRPPARTWGEREERERESSRGVKEKARRNRHNVVLELERSHRHSRRGICALRRSSMPHRGRMQSRFSIVAH
jgi:hypothetical protein